MSELNGEDGYSQQSTIRVAEYNIKGGGIDIKYLGAKAEMQYVSLPSPFINE